MEESNLFGFEYAWKFNSNLRNIVEIGFGKERLREKVSKDFSQIQSFVSLGRAQLTEIPENRDAIFIETLPDTENVSRLRVDLMTVEALQIMKNKLSPKGFVAIRHVSPKEEDLLLISFQIAQTVSMVFPYVLLVKVGPGEFCLYGSIDLPESYDNRLVAYEAHPKGFPFFDATTADQEFITASWVREYLDKASKRPYQLQKFTQTEALALSKARIQKNLKPWLDQLPGYTGKGVTVYAVDTGIPLAHQEFQKNQAENRFHNLGSPPDSKGHGTHVASLVCGERLGLAPDCVYLGINALSSEAQVQTKSLIGFLKKLIELKPKEEMALLNIHVCTARTPDLDQMIDQLSDHGFICILGAGNYNGEVKNYSPAGHPRAITVGATDNLSRRWPFSNYGEELTLSVLGQSLIGAHHHNSEAYFWLSGSSVSCALVTGLAALYFEKNPQHTVDDFRNFLKSPITSYSEV